MLRLCKSLLIVIAAVSSLSLHATFTEHNSLGGSDGVFMVYSENGVLGELIYHKNNIYSYYNKTLKQNQKAGNTYGGPEIKGIGSLMLEAFIYFKLPKLALGEKISVNDANGSYGHYVSQGFIPKSDRHGKTSMRPMFSRSVELAAFCSGTLEFEKLSSEQQNIFFFEKAQKARRIGRESATLSRDDVCMINLRAETLARVLNYLMLGGPLDVEDLFVDRITVSLELIPELRTALKKRRSGMCVL